ncbi:fucolectin-like [Clarias gariepinus]|uniref:fucolectin-like n=1 Tax=Clarias gariepinus TaxID=13013 RepID=UPI00234C81C3|nr:fucolectin-like [Clarias gariepinus]
MGGAWLSAESRVSASGRRQELLSSLAHAATLSAVHRICIFSSHWILTHQKVDLALGGIATQSSLFQGTSYPANLAIDGNTASSVGSGSCAHTSPQYDAWWRVDLLAEYLIGTVVITNRGDCCSERINGAEIHIGNSLNNSGNNNPRCVVIPSIPAGASASYTCNMMGRYVNIIIPNIYQALTLCEVQVYEGPTIKWAFLGLKINSSEDLSNPAMKNNILKMIKSANMHSSIFQIRWKIEPELKPIT